MTQTANNRNKKPYIIIILGFIAVVLLLAGIKVAQFGTMIASGESFVPPPESVTTASTKQENWETTLKAIGSLTAVEGVVIAAQQAGQITQIAFTPGSDVQAGELLLQQDISTEQAQLRSALANAELTKINLQRSQDLNKKNLTSKSDLDAARARHKQAVADIDRIRSQIEKKSIRAPFAGRLGTREVFLGQHLREGDAIVSLQALDLLTVDFTLPQQYLSEIKAGLPVRIATDASPDTQFSGLIQAIDSKVNAQTRNVQVQASVPNPDKTLLPGVYVNVEIILPTQEPVLSIPATAVLYASYGPSVFVVEEKQDEKTGKKSLLARQQFVKLGRTKGDFVAVQSGLQQNDLIVSTGAFKLFNGQAIVENNDLAPKFELDPKPTDS